MTTTPSMITCGCQSLYSLRWVFSGVMGDEGEEDGEQDRLHVKLAPPTNSDNLDLENEKFYVQPVFPLNSKQPVLCSSVTHFKNQSTHHIDSQNLEFSTAHSLTAPVQHVYNQVPWS